MKTYYRMHYLIIFLLIFFNIDKVRQRLIEQGEYDNPETCLAINEDYLVLAQNTFQRFTIIERPFSSDPIPHLVTYNSVRVYSSQVFPLSYVYNIITGNNQTGNSSAFALIGKDEQDNMYLVVIRINKFPNFFLKESLSRPLNRPYSLRALTIAIHPKATHAYAVDISSTHCLDINENTSVSYPNVDIWDKGHFAFSRALVITEDYRFFLLAYRLTEPSAEELLEKTVLFLYTVNASNMSMPIRLGTVELPVRHPDHYFSGDGQYTAFSLSVHEESNMIVVGIPHKDMVIVLSSQNQSDAPIIIRKHVSSQTNTFFGKSVVMLDANTYAVLAHSIPTLPWSSSQIQVNTSKDL